MYVTRYTQTITKIKSLLLPLAKVGVIFSLALVYLSDDNIKNNITRIKRDKIFGMTAVTENAAGVSGTDIFNMAGCNSSKWLVIIHCVAVIPYVKS